jgi:carbon monoxide dehydrogenase subunit G
VGTFDLVRRVPADPERTFEVFADFRRHGDFIPMTTITADDGPPRPGWRFTAVSGLGRLALVDRMEVGVWNPPHEFRIDKLGPMLDGWAHVHVIPEAGQTRVVWRERIVVRPAVLGRPASVVTDPVNRLMFGRALDKMAERAAAGSR